MNYEKFVNLNIGIEKFLRKPILLINRWAFKIYESRYAKELPSKYSTLMTDITSIGFTIMASLGLEKKSITIPKWSQIKLYQEDYFPTLNPYILGGYGRGKIIVKAKNIMDLTSYEIVSLTHEVLHSMFDLYWQREFSIEQALIDVEAMEVAHTLLTTLATVDYIRKNARDFGLDKTDQYFLLPLSYPTTVLPFLDSMKNIHDIKNNWINGENTYKSDMEIYLKQAEVDENINGFLSLIFRRFGLFKFEHQFKNIRLETLSNYFSEIGFPEIVSQGGRIYHDVSRYISPKKWKNITSEASLGRLNAPNYQKFIGNVFGCDELLGVDVSDVTYEYVSLKDAKRFGLTRGSLAVKIPVK